MFLRYNAPTGDPIITNSLVVASLLSGDGHHEAAETVHDLVAELIQVRAQLAVARYEKARIENEAPKYFDEE